MDDSEYESNKLTQTLCSFEDKFNLPRFCSYLNESDSTKLFGDELVALLCVMSVNMEL